MNKHLLEDSGMYVQICMNEALKCCYVVALCFFVLVYVVVSLFGRSRTDEK